MTTPAKSPAEKRKRGRYQFRCKNKNCRGIRSKDAYCIAQQAMGHTVYFTCTCGYEQEVP